MDLTSFMDHPKTEIELFLKQVQQSSMPFSFKIRFHFTPFVKTSHFGRSDFF